MITHKREFDLAKPKIVSHIFAGQGEGNTRSLEAKLFENGTAWTPPSNASIAVAFKKPDGTRGVYDMLPNGDQAITATGNTVTAILAPQVLTCPGEVVAALIFVDQQNGNKLMSFPFCIMVAEDPSAGADVSNNYFYFTSFDAINDAIGDMSKLETNDKTSLVAAINAASRTGGSVSNEQIAYAVEKYLKENPIAAGDVYYVTATVDRTDDPAEVSFTIDRTIEEIQEAAYGDLLPIVMRFPYLHVNGNTMYCNLALVTAHGGSASFGGAIYIDDDRTEIITAYLEGDDYRKAFRKVVDGSVSDEQIAAAVNDALELAKESGEFKGDPGPAGPQGEPGPAGATGTDGLTPYIGENGNWWIGEEDTGVSAGGGSSSGGGVETLFDFTSTEAATTIQLLIETEAVKQALENAHDIYIGLYVPRDTADTTITTKGKATIKLNHGSWSETVIPEFEATPAPSETWSYYHTTTIVLIRNPKMGDKQGHMCLMVRKNSSANGANSQSCINAFSPSTWTVGKKIEIVCTQNMAAGTRFVLEARA